MSTRNSPRGAYNPYASGQTQVDYSNNGPNNMMRRRGASSYHTNNCPEGMMMSGAGQCVPMSGMMRRRGASSYHTCGPGMMMSGAGQCVAMRRTRRAARKMRAPRRRR